MIQSSDSRRSKLRIPAEQRLEALWELTALNSPE